MKKESVVYGIDVVQAFLLYDYEVCIDQGKLIVFEGKYEMPNDMFMSMFAELKIHEKGYIKKYFK